MKLFLIERNDQVDYDEYDSAVIVAETPEQALQILKDRHGTYDWSNGWRMYDVNITEIIPTVAGIVIESFNAG